MRDIRRWCERQRTHADRCVVSIFVNPLQFGSGEDFEEYPRSLVADEAFLADTLVDVIFAPSAEVMYPEGPEGGIDSQRWRRRGHV
jgi:pantoate--beta-alanine ligase